MPERKPHNTSSKPTIYVNPISGVKIIDENYGKLTVKLDGDSNEYILHTKASKGCCVQKYQEKLFGKYTKVYFQDNDFVREIAKLIIGW